MDSSSRESEFDFFDEPDTAETAGQAWRRRLRPAEASRPGGSGRGPVLPRGLDRLGRLAALVTVVIASVVALVTGLGGCKGSSDNYSQYLERVRVIAEGSNRVGDELAHDLRASLKPADLARRLQTLAAQEQQAYDRAEQIRPPGPLRQIHEELLAALELRATGLASLGQTLVAAEAHTTPAASVANALAAQAQLLTTSDVVWSELYRTPATDQLRQRGLTDLLVPDSQVVTSPGLVSATSFVHRLLPTHTSNTRGPVASLKSGDSGSAVASWQRQLNQWLRTQPGQSPVPVDGKYGNRTATATKTLQHVAGITADGVVGPATRHALTVELATVKRSSGRG